MIEGTPLRSGVLFWALCLLLSCTIALPAYAQADWSAKVINQRDPDKKELIASRHAQKQGVSDETLFRLSERERHGPAVAKAVGQYFEKATRVPESFLGLRSVVNRSDIGDKAIVFAAMSPISDDLIKALTASREEIDRQNAARMIATLAYMRYTDRQGESPVPADQPPKPGQANNKPAWLQADHTEQLKTLLETSKSRVTLECAFLAAGLDRNEALLELAKENMTHRVQEVAFAARYAVAAMGGEIDATLQVADFANAEKRKAKGPLSYDIRQSPLAYLAMAAGEAQMIEAVDPLIAVLGNRDVHAAVAAARALGKIGGDGNSLRLLGAITPETPWPVRLAIYDSVGANPDAAAVPLLLERFEAEPGRLRQDVLYALLSIVADDSVQMTIEGFNSWWQLNGESFDANPDATQEWRQARRVSDVFVPAFSGFYETAVISDNLVFAFDASKSINDQQLDLLKQTLTDLFESLPAEMRFNVIDFGGHVRMLAKGRMVEGKVKERALGRFLQKTELTFGTWIFEAIEMSMDLPDVDTVHFLSDGQPWGSELNSWQRADYATRVRCATLPVAVNVILTPRAGKPEQVAKRPLARQMKRFAEAHAGRFQIIVPEAE